jgi:hypothetical protein
MLGALVLLIMSKHVADMKEVSNSMSVSCHADDNAFVTYVMCCVHKIEALYKFFPEQVVVQK